MSRTIELWNPLPRSLLPAKYVGTWIPSSIAEGKGDC